VNRKWVAARKKAGLPADLVLPPRHSKALTMKQMDTVFSYGTRIGTRMKNGIHTSIPPHCIDPLQPTSHRT
jgi:hypothetical protein